MAKYQGKELQSTLQAPNAASLQEMVNSAKRFAGENKLEDFKVIEFGPDPDGGYRAIVTAHNWNPISWIKGKLTKKKAAEEELQLPSGADEGVLKQAKGDYEEDWKKKYEEQVLKAKAAEFAKREEEEARRREAADASHWRQFGGKKGAGESEEEYNRRMSGASKAGKESERGWRPGLTEEELSKMPRGQRRKYQKQEKEASRERQEVEFELWKEGVPEEVVRKQKILQKEYWTKKGTDEPVPEPRTAEERAASDYHPSQWGYIDIPIKLSPAERAGYARAIQFEKMELDITKEKYKQFKRERHPAYRAAKAAAGATQFMAGAVTMGVAGMARGSRPGRGGPERAMRMHAPGLPLDLYAVRPMLGVGMPSSKDLTGAGLSNLRALTFPGIRKTKKQVQQVRRSVEQER